MHTSVLPVPVPTWRRSAALWAVSRPNSAVRLAATGEFSQPPDSRSPWRVLKPAVVCGIRWIRCRRWSRRNALSAWASKAISLIVCRFREPCGRARGSRTRVASRVALATEQLACAASTSVSSQAACCGERVNQEHAAGTPRRRPAWTSSRRSRAGVSFTACVGIGSPPYANEYGGIEYRELPVEPVIIASDAAQARAGKTP